MQKEEASTLGIDDLKRRAYFRVDDAKANMRPPNEKAAWRFLADVDMENSRPGLAADRVGVATAWTKPEIQDGITAKHVAAIRERLAAGAPNRRDVRSPDWVGITVGEAGFDVNGDKLAQRRASAIVDVLVKAKALRVAKESNGKGRSVDVLVGVPGYLPKPL